MEIASQYNPKDHEKTIYASWEESGSFSPKEGKPGKEPYCIMMPPPNVTGALHLGHAINNTLQDIQIRYHRMLGCKTLWQPGTDHAGIATQAVVEKNIFEKEGKTRHDLGREELVKRIWQWKEQYGGRILRQLRAMGCSCDWEHLRFTLDPVCAKAVRTTFLGMFKAGLIYRGKRLVNWDVKLQTSVSDDEVVYETVKSNLWHLKYQVEGSDEYLEVATTRPETFFGDTAVAVHPEDERYKHLIGKNVILPLVKRPIPIIGDALLVDREFGTGCVKVTPAHDPNDYLCGKRNKLPEINILNPDGTLNEVAGQFAGMDRLKARPLIVKALEESGDLLKTEPYTTQVGHSDRSKTPIEPYLSDQWFVVMADMAEAAMEAVRSGKIKFHPARFAKSYLDWLSEKRDWPISRQLWWGHRIPIWYVKGATEEDMKAAFAGNEEVSYRYDQEHDQFLLCSSIEDFKPETKLPKAEIKQEEDVLDTWFSSALWPHSTLGWPDKNERFETFYPNSVLITNRDIISLWVARMVMTAHFNTNNVPFRDVMIHVTILDGMGKRMSKSKGNGVDPEDIIAQYGADALRFSMTQMSSDTQDMRVPVQYRCPHCETLFPQTEKNMKAETLECPSCKKTMATRWANEETQKKEGLALLTSAKFEIGRNFGNKIWNASRFAMQNLDASTPLYTLKELKAALEKGEIAPLNADEEWIITRLEETVKEVTSAIEGYRYHEYANKMYDFMWNEFCDWYLEAIKPVLRQEGAKKAGSQAVLATVIETALRLLHPMMPFETEAIYANLLAITEQKRPMLINAEWPEVAGNWCDELRLAYVMRKYELISLGRSMRSAFNIGPGQKASFVLRPENAELERFLEGERETLTRFLTAGELTISCAFKPEGAMPCQVAPEVAIYLKLDGSVDIPAERKKVEKQIGEVTGYVASLEKKLGNVSFTSHAPAEVIEKEKNKLAEAKEKLTKLQDLFAMLKEA
ncbi:valine--tRNA ligase [bacterium]|nr:valine--tRNA ligase [bacterium]